MNLTIAMMKYPINTVHGHSHSELEALLEDSCQAFDDFINLEHTSMGGWSNINIHGKSSGFDFVLKLPAVMTEFEHNPYDHQFKLALSFARLDITAHPIEIGRLSDTAQTPYYLGEYIEGTTHYSMTDVSEGELLSLKESLRILKEQKPPDIPKYDSPSEYLIANHEPVENHDWLSRASKGTQDLLSQYNLLFPRVTTLTDIHGYWSREVMHGDLWIPNVIFRSEQKALLLDFEACSYGDPRYDLSSLLERYGGDSSIESISALLRTEDIDVVNSLRPLALAWVIDWSLERLLSMEEGIIEPNLNSRETHARIHDYTQERMDRLKSILH